MADSLRDALANKVADELYRNFRLHGGMTASITAIVLATLVKNRDDVLAHLGMEQVGWWVEERHKHTLPASEGVISGEFRFTEEDDVCSLGSVPVYAAPPPTKEPS